MKKYTVKKISAGFTTDGDILKPQWESANQLTIDNYPWYKSGLKQKTVVKMLHDDKSIFALFLCEDKHIHAERIGLNSLVCLDSCVEFFADPGTGNYFNLEMNCCGTMLIGYGLDRYKRTLVSQRIADKINFFKSVPGTIKSESPDDESWFLEIEIPLSMIEELTNVKIEKLSGKSWKVNFFRCGGKTDDQYACWSPIVAPKPDYHRPEYFGDIIFE